MTIALQITSPDLPAILQLLDTLSDGNWIKNALKRQIPRIEEVQRRQYEDVRQLPYSAAYIGRLKPSGKVAAGGAGDKGFALDTEALYGDVTKVRSIDDDMLQIYSDLIYAGYQEELIESKGSSLWADDEVYLGLMEMTLSTDIDKLWGAP